jgi:diaphanous 1
MNGTTAKGGAYGFKIDIIEKCIDVKALDNKRTLLMYLID